jgi:hypothetical protein
MGYRGQRKCQSMLGRTATLKLNDGRTTKQYKRASDINYAKEKWILLLLLLVGVN